MLLVATPENPIPPGARAEMIRAADGVRLRTARWVPAHATRGTVSIFSGRAEFIEKYFEVVADLLDRGFAVATLDWRGQGGSARALRNPRKGHIDDFSHFERDIEAFVDDVLGPSCPKPWFALCHSMGGAIMLDAAHSGRCPFERVVMTSPMIEIFGVNRRRGAQALAEVLDALGFGGAYAPGGGSKSITTAPFAGNALTSDPVRYALSAAIAEAAPHLALGWPTVGWVHAAFRLIARFADPDYPRTNETPTLLIAAGDDRVTDTRAAERFASRLRNGRLIVIEGARHEILMERDSLRDQLWAAFDQFIPGAEPAKARSA